MMQVLDITLAVVAAIALVLAYVGWTRKDPATSALLNAKQAEADAKDGLIQRLQGEIDELDGYKVKAERIPELEAEVEKIRGERDSYFGKASEHNTLTKQPVNLVYYFCTKTSLCYNSAKRYGQPCLSFPPFSKIDDLDKSISCIGEPSFMDYQSSIHCTKAHRVHNAVKRHLHHLCDTRVKQLQ